MYWRTGMTVAVVVTLQVLPASAYFIQYEGNMFPEDDGWTPPPIDTGGYTRSINDGVFTIDATPLECATVFYNQSIDIRNYDFVYEWRAKTSNDDGFSYQSIMIDGEGLVSKIGVTWGSTCARIALIPDAGEYEGTILDVDIIPGRFHTYRVESRDSLYHVYIDDVPVANAILQSPYNTTITPQFGFCKNLANIPTIAEWDFVRGWYVPEPTMLSLLPLVTVFIIRRDRAGI